MVRDSFLCLLPTHHTKSLLLLLTLGKEYVFCSQVVKYKTALLFRSQLHEGSLGGVRRINLNVYQKEKILRYIMFYLYHEII